jgi:hypothetical protein
MATGVGEISVELAGIAGGQGNAPAAMPPQNCPEPFPLLEEDADTAGLAAGHNANSQFGPTRPT